MSEQIVFKYQDGTISGGYSFSANSNIIILPKYVAELKNDKIREAIQYEAQTARSLYIAEIKRLKANNVKFNPLAVKNEAIRKAKNQMRLDGICEPTYKLSEQSTEPKNDDNKLNITHLFVVAVPETNELFNTLSQTIKANSTEGADKL